MAGPGEPEPGIGPHADALNGVAATRAGAWAVGERSDPNGAPRSSCDGPGRSGFGRRAPTSTPTAPLSNVLTGVAAISPSNVWAVGTFSGAPIGPAALHCAAVRAI